MASPNKIAIRNVRVFDGSKITEPTTVVLDGDRIGSDATDALEVDGKGGTLLPGLIDAHVHVRKHDELLQMARAGITTALDMGSFPREMVDSFHNQHGVTDYLSAGLPLTAPGSTHSKIYALPKEAQVVSAEQARDFVTRRVKDGSDYIKLIADTPGPSQETLNAAVAEAKAHGKLTVIHAAKYEAFGMAIEAKACFLTHAPLDKDLEEADAKKMADENQGCIPTLAMMERMHKLRAPTDDYAHCKVSVKRMLEAGVPILAGTDANAAPGAPTPVKHGDCLHRELELLVQAGMSAVEVLRAATSETAKRFGLTDRGVIGTGKKADVLLIPGDPVEDIGAVRGVKRVWCAGVEVL